MSKMDLKELFVRKVTCPHCKIKFTPHPRLGKRQLTCGNSTCRIRHRTNYQRKYRRKNKDLEFEYQKKRKENLPDNYWKVFRLRHPIYVMRNREATRLRKLLKKHGLQRKLDIGQASEKTVHFITFCEFATRHRSLVKVATGIDAA